MTEAINCRCTSVPVEEPKPCPFCGHTAIETGKNGTTHSCMVWCEGCGAMISGCSSEEAALNAWNERADTKDESSYNGGNK